MKKKILTITAVFMIFAMIFAISGCDLFGEAESFPDIDPNDVIGTWVRNASTGTDTFIFNENGTFTRNKAGSVSRGTYTVSGHEIFTQSSENAKDSTSHIVRFSEDKYTMTWGDGAVKYEYIKQH